MFVRIPGDGADNHKWGAYCWIRLLLEYFPTIHLRCYAMCYVKSTQKKYFVSSYDI